MERKIIEKKTLWAFKFAILIMSILAMVGCVEKYDEDEDVVNIAFPSEFIGTWERDYQSPYTNTLTFTSNTVQASNQTYHWELQSISGDSYTIKSSKSGTLATNVFRLNNGKLEIIDNDVSISDSENIWTGTWKKQ